MTSYYETMPYALLEALALGIPVVGVEYSFFSKMVFPEITHSPADFFGIRESLHRLITDDEFRIELAELGMERIDQFNLKNSKERYLTELRTRVGDKT